MNAAFKKGTKVSFTDSRGAKHYGIVEDVVPTIGGGYIYSVLVKALDKIMTVEQPKRIKK